MNAREFDDVTVLEALERLFMVARSDTGQSKRVADFLLAWHNAGENGGWDPSDLWSLDRAIAMDIVTVVSALPRWSGQYPGDVGFPEEIDRVWREWRGNRPAKRRGR